jgi:hypothetical protein
MAKSLKPEVDVDELYLIKIHEQQRAREIKMVESVKKFSLGDYLILHRADDMESTMRLQLNSYGAPVKYKVVHVDVDGLPYIKRISQKGKTIGHIMSCTGSLNNDDYCYGETHEFMLDPDYADSILLQDKYDPAHLHKSKKDIWKAVTGHNKACKINTANSKNLAAFWTTVNIGDTLWTSPSGYYLVQDKKTILIKDFNEKAPSKHRMWLTSNKATVIVLTVRDKNSKVMDIAPSFFEDKVLYKEKPRTYKELNI